MTDTTTRVPVDAVWLRDEADRIDALQRMFIPAESMRESMDTVAADLRALAGILEQITREDVVNLTLIADTLRDYYPWAEGESWARAVAAKLAALLPK